MQKEGYALALQNQLARAHELLRQNQLSFRTTDNQEPPLFEIEDLVWWKNERTRRGKSSKLLPKFIGLYHVSMVHLNHTYKIEQVGKFSVEAESRLKLHQAPQNQIGMAPPLSEPFRQPALKGTRSQGVVEGIIMLWARAINMKGSLYLLPSLHFKLHRKHQIILMRHTAQARPSFCLEPMATAG